MWEASERPQAPFAVGGLGFEAGDKMQSRRYVLKRNTSIVSDADQVAVLAALGAAAWASSDARLTNHRAFLRARRIFSRRRARGS